VSIDLDRAEYRRVTRTTTAANGQIRVWVEVEPGEEVMLKLPAGADVREAVRAHLRSLRQEARQAERDALPTRDVRDLRLADVADELARVDAEIERLTARRAGLLLRVR